MSNVERVTVRFEPDAVTWYVDGSSPGPAGSVGRSLADGVWLAVDAAEPDRLVQLKMTRHDDSRRGAAARHEALSLVARLLGDDIAAQLSAPAGDRRVETEVRCASTATLQAAGRLALLQDVRAVTARDHPSPWWAAEAAMLARKVGGRQCYEFARSEARQAAPGLAALTERPAGWWRGLDPCVVDRIRMLAENVRDLLDSSDLVRPRRQATREVRRRLSALVDELRVASGESGLSAVDAADLPLLPDGSGVPPGSPVPLPGTWGDGAPSQRREEASIRVDTFRDRIGPELYRALAPDKSLQILMLSRFRLRIVVPLRADAGAEELDGLFVRVFDADTRVLLGAAEVRPGATGTSPIATADVVLPRRFLADHGHRTIARLELDLTSRPDEPVDRRPGRRALWVGRLAAQAGRLGDCIEAARRWGECSRLWHELGDPHRSRQAASYASAAALHPTAWLAGEYLEAILDPRGVEPVTRAWRPWRGEVPPSPPMASPGDPHRDASARPAGSGHFVPDPSTLAQLAMLAIEDRPGLVSLTVRRLDSATRTLALKLRLRAYPTIIGSVASAVVASVLVLTGHLVLAGFAMMLGWFFEIFDARLAMLSSDGRRAVYVDQVIDRLVEIMLLSAIAWYHYTHHAPLVALFSMVTLVLALFASYERAQSEAFSFTQGYLIFGRIIRIIFLVPAVMSPWTLPLMAMITGVTLLSLLSRFVRVLREWREMDAPDTAPRVAWDPRVITPRLQEPGATDGPALPTAVPTRADEDGPVRSPIQGSSARPGWPHRHG